MTDDIRPMRDAGQVDLVVVGGITVDVMNGGTEVAGGAARYATEAALGAGLRVALHTVAGSEPAVDVALDQLARGADVVRHRATTSIRFEHHGADGGRRLRLTARGEPVPIPDPAHLPAAAAVLFAPVADEVGASVLGILPAAFRAAGIQGWLREVDHAGWAVPRPLGVIDPDLSAALRDLDLLLASDQDLGASDGPSALAQLRAWAGPGPELVITAGAEGAWFDDGVHPATHMPAQVIEGRSTVGAGDAFAALMTARRGAGLAPLAALQDAARSTARYLAARPGA